MSALDVLGWAGWALLVVSASRHYARLGLAQAGDRWELDLNGRYATT